MPSEAGRDRPRPAPARSADPVGTAEDALLLIETGRIDMARRVLTGLSDLIRAALDAAKPPPPSPTQLQLQAAELTRLRSEACALAAEIAHLRGEQRQAEAEIASRRREVAKLDTVIAKRRRTLERSLPPPAAPRSPKPHQVLAQALADGQVTAERVAGMLRLQPSDIGPIAAGKVGLANSAWKRLLAVLETGT